VSTAFVPQQQPQPPDAPPPVPPHASEATRLLCAGAYLDPAYRDRVIEELYVNEQRFVAPSLGFDAARVLAHALRARRQEVQWAWAVLGLWLVGAVLSGGRLVLFLVPSVLLAIGGWIHGGDPDRHLYRAGLAFLLRWAGGLFFLVLMLALVAAAFGGGRIEPWRAWAVFVIFVLIAACLAGQRGRFARVLAAELSPRRFPDAVNDPAERDPSRRVQMLKHRIRTEQHAPLVMYHEARPFCGAGVASREWVLSVELKPVPSKKQQPLSNRLVLEQIRPRVERLRVPAECAGTGVRDRLRWLEIDECVFLPAEGLLRREDAPYHPQAFEEHRARAVEEGAEKRRHFLRIRVGGWEEELVVTVFVRIHTQGGMLMLEIAPHVLLPVRPDFKDADRAAHRFRHNSSLGKAVWAMSRVPGSLAGSLAALSRSGVHRWGRLTGGYAGALPDGPALSVRELGSGSGTSQFQEMDVARYLKSIQERVAHGVRAALAEAGYQTGEFIQQVYNISNGGVHIGRVQGSTFAVGDHSAASSTTGGGTPRKGSGSDDHGG